MSHLTFDAPALVGSRKGKEHVWRRKKNKGSEINLNNLCREGKSKDIVGRFSDASIERIEKRSLSNNSQHYRWIEGIDYSIYDWKAHLDQIRITVSIKRWASIFTYQFFLIIYFILARVSYHRWNVGAMLSLHENLTSKDTCWQFHDILRPWSKVSC